MYAFEHEYLSKFPEPQALTPFFSDLSLYVPPRNLQQDTPLDDALIHFLYGRQPPTPDLEAELNQWHDIAARYAEAVGFDEIQPKVLIPRHSKVFGKYEESSQYFHVADGAINLAKFTKHGVPIDEYVTARYESGRTHIYTSFTGVQLTIPWDSSDTRIAQAKKTPNIRMQDVPHGELPVMILDMDIDTQRKELIVYEISPHKFGWYFGIYKDMFVPNAAHHSFDERVVRAKSLASQHPAIAQLQQDAQHAFRSHIGTRISDRFDYGLRAAHQLATLTLGQEPTAIWVLDPCDIYTLRSDERLIGTQVSLERDSAASQAVIKRLYRHSETVRVNDLHWIVSHI